MQTNYIQHESTLESFCLLCYSITMSDKKIFEKSPTSGIAVPIAIVLFGALIIFGVTKMLSTGKDYKDLVAELQSKTFGNRWVAAFELSKYIAGNKIPASEVPWLVDNLASVYTSSQDTKTRQFVITAIGALHSPQASKVLSQALLETDPEIKYQAMIAISQLPRGSVIDWTQVYRSFDLQDKGLIQVALLTIAEHKEESGKGYLLQYLQNQDSQLQLTSALGLIPFQEKSALPVLQSILQKKDADRGELTSLELEGIKFNILELLEKNPWTDLALLVSEYSLQDPNIKISTKARQVLNLLKN